MVILRIVVCAAALLLARPSFAEDAPAETRVHHTPVSLTAAHEVFRLTATVERPDLAKRVIAAVRTTATQGGFREVPFDRTDSGFVAEVPAELVVGAELEYAVEVIGLDGAHRAVFATRLEPFKVQVPDDIADLRERALLDRLDHRRSVVEVSGEYAYFGTTAAVRDEYWRTDASYTYRFLRTVAEFGIRFGVVRGSAIVPAATDPSSSNVGLNYGAPRLRIRLVDWCNIEGELLTSVTEVGFSLGGGGSVLFGDAYGSHLTLGIEGIQVFGVRGWSRVDVAAGSRVLIGATVEVTNMPHASDAGVRLLLDMSIDLGKGFGLALRGGYQARTFDQGGPAVGLGVRYAF